MILETAQLLCGAHIVLDDMMELNGVTLYKLTHKNHPCAVWLRQSSANYVWLYELFCGLCDEYVHRYHKTHKCDTTFRHVLSYVPRNIPIGDRVTKFALAMPEECRREDEVESYREYYRTNKRHLCEWKDRPEPEWFAEVKITTSTNEFI
jgi:hypothetical protein